MDTYEDLRQNTQSPARTGTRQKEKGTMSRQYVVTGRDGLVAEGLIERRVPEPGPGQVLIEVRAAGVNPVDSTVRPDRLGRGASTPVPVGREAAGVVIAVGPDVRGPAVGEAVFGVVAPGEGAFADHALLSASDAVAKPENISFEVAATIPIAGATAYDLTHQIELDAGQTMLVLGAGGGVGHLVTQIGQVHEFRVIGVAPPAQRELVEAYGATFVAAGGDAFAEVRRLAPDGVDLLVDLVGGEALWDLAPTVISPDRVLSAADPDTARQIGGTGRVGDAGSLTQITSVIEYELITPWISATHTLADARGALAAVGAGHARGKVVIVP